MTTPTDPMPRLLALPRLQRNEVQARNLIASRARDAEVRLQGRLWLLSLQPWPAGAAPSAPSTDDWLLLLEWAGAPFELRLPASFAQTLLSAAQDGLDLPAWPEAFVASFLQSVLQEVTGHSALAKRGAVQVRALQRSDDPAQAPGSGAEARTLPHVFGLVLADRDAGTPLAIELSVSTDTLGLMLVAGLAQTVPLAATPEHDDLLPLRLRAELGCTDLTAAELASLVPGDTVMLAHNWIDQEAGLWLGWDGLGIRAVWEQDHLRVTHLLNSRGLSMPTDPHAAPEGDDLHDVEQVPVRLTFDLGERMLTLGDLRALQVGQVLEMGRPLSQAVSVRVNGALIGSGELVDIDGQLGVTLVSLSRAGTRSA